MKLLDNLKRKTENGRNREDAKEFIKDTLKDVGRVISDDELEDVSGGGGFYPVMPKEQMR